MTIIATVLLVMGIVRTASTKEVMCPESEAYGQIVVSCSGKYLTDDNYVPSLHWTFDRLRPTASENQSMALRFVFNKIQRLKVLPNRSRTRITEISFKYNQISSSENGVFRNLPHLKSLDLSYNKLAGENLTKDLFRGKELNEDYESLSVEHINLGSNKITSLRPDTFTYLPNLRSLDLSRNPINSVTPELEDAFHRIKMLQVLSLAQTELSYIPYSLFDGVPLQKLFLNGNRFTQVPSSISRLSRSLWFLNLNDNPIREINSYSFDNLSKLTELHLSGMKKLTNISENAFSPLINLEILQCSFNPILEFIDPTAFTNSKNEWNLKELYINNNNIKFLSEETVDWTKLSLLDIRGNPWNCTCSLHWLFNYVKERQTRDPEENLGILCKYPAQLNKFSFMQADSFLGCADKNDYDFTVPYVKRVDTSLFFVLVLVLCFATYFIIKRAQNKPKRKHLRSSIIVSSAKYKRALLNDVNEFEAV